MQMCCSKNCENCLKCAHHRLHIGIVNKSFAYLTRRFVVVFLIDLPLSATAGRLRDMDRTPVGLDEALNFTRIGQI